MDNKENIEDWRPSFKKDGKTFYYERSWFCQENLAVHNSEKAVLNCPHCSKKYYKPTK